MRFLLACITLLFIQPAKAIDKVDITPSNAANYDIAVTKESFGEGYRFQVTFPSSQEGLDGFAVVNVAYARQEDPSYKTVQIPQFKGMAIIVGDEKGLKESFVVISYSSGKDIKKIYFVHPGSWSGATNTLKDQVKDESREQ